MTRSLPVSMHETVEVALPDALLQRARELGVDVTQACERGLALEIQAVLRRRWLAENQSAIQAWNDYVAEHGLPLAAYRQF